MKRTYLFVFLLITSALIFSPAPARAATPSLDSEQWAFLTAINNFRAQNGVGPLQVSATLQTASQWMSDDLAAKSYFSHTDSLGRDAGTRLAAFGYPYYWGENIAAGNSTALATLDQWINSAGHRANMLNPLFKVIGIGRAYNPASPYRWYWTTDFGGTIDQVITPPGGGGGGGTTSPPVISSFTANPASIAYGQGSILSWNVSNADSINLSGFGNVTGFNSISVFPTQTTTFTLTALNSGGTKTATVTVTVSAPPASDSQPPTAPAIVSITATSANQVNLSWTASTDNVGVIGYQVLRNGSLVANLAGTSFSDTGVAPSTAYSYTVRAFDAASNYSQPSNPATVTTPAQTPSGTPCPAPANGQFTGCYFSNVLLNGNPVFVRTDSQINFDWGATPPNASLPSTGYSVRWLGNFDFAGGDYTFTATTSDGMRLYIDGAVAIDAWRDQAPTVYTSRLSIAQGSHLITVEHYSRTGSESAHLSWLLNAPSGRRGASPPSISFFSGTPATITAGQSSTLSWSVAGATSVTLDNGIGNVTSVTTKTVTPTQTTTYKLTAMNDAGSVSATVTIAVNSTQGDSQPPSAPVLTSATAKSASQVDLSWTASNDNVGVTGYQILRNGSVLTTVSGGSLSYADTSVAASTSYAYTIRAFDAVGNLSQPSNSITSTTPAPPAADPCGDPGTGAFKGCYYNNLTLSGSPAIVRTDNQVNFDWTGGSPNPALLTPYNFSVRWQGYFDFQAGDYNFTALTSDGMRVYVDGVLIIDSWRDQAPNLYTSMRSITAGRHLVKVEYYLRTGTGAAHLTWQPAGRSGR